MKTTAKSKPWFKNTIFIIVADHCGSSAGRTALPIKKYEIPLIIYNPTLFRPEKIETLCSQIDLAPTLLGLLNWTYKSRFLGKDIKKSLSLVVQSSFLLTSSPGKKRG